MVSKAKLIATTAFLFCLGSAVAAQSVNERVSGDIKRAPITAAIKMQPMRHKAAVQDLDEILRVTPKADMPREEAALITELGQKALALRNALAYEDDLRARIETVRVQTGVSKRNKVSRAQLLESLNDRLQTAGEDAQLAIIDLQNTLQRQQQIATATSNVSKQTHGSVKAVIQNIKG